MFRKILLLGVAATFVITLGGGARADKRQYLATYGYYTAEKGEWEIEQYTDSFFAPNGDATLQSKTELEYRITDRLMTSVYLVNKKPDGESFDYAETKLQFRYRLNEPGNQFWDTAGYFELVRPSDSDKPYKMELKAIFSHEFPKFNLSANIISEKKLEDGQKVVFGYAVGAAPHMTGRIRYSFEAFGKEGKYYVMPTLWLSPGEKQNFGIGIAKGLNGRSDSTQLRTLYSMEF